MEMLAQEHDKGFKELVHERMVEEWQDIWDGSGTGLKYVFIQDDKEWYNNRETCIKCFSLSATKCYSF